MTEPIPSTLEDSSEIEFSRNRNYHVPGPQKPNSNHVILDLIPSSVLNPRRKPLAPLNQELFAIQQEKKRKQEEREKKQKAGRNIRKRQTTVRQREVGFSIPGDGEEQQVAVIDFSSMEETEESPESSEAVASQFSKQSTRRSSKGSTATYTSNFDSKQRPYLAQNSYFDTRHSSKSTVASVGDETRKTSKESVSTAASIQEYRSRQRKKKLKGRSHKKKQIKPIERLMYQDVDETKRLRTLFEKFDPAGDGNGELTIDLTIKILKEENLSFTVEEMPFLFLQTFQQKDKLSINFDEFQILLKKAKTWIEMKDHQKYDPENSDYIGNLYDEFDSSGEGHMNEMDLYNVTKFLKLDLSEVDIKILLRQIDLDGNGTIEKEELITFFREVKNREEFSKRLRSVAKNKPDQNNDFLESIFHKFDTTATGSLNENQLAHIMEFLRLDFSQKSVSNLMEAMDTDGNGSVELNEFLDFFGTVQKWGDLRESCDQFNSSQQQKKGLLFCTFWILLVIGIAILAIGFEEHKSAWDAYEKNVAKIREQNIAHQDPNTAGTKNVDEELPDPPETPMMVAFAILILVLDFFVLLIALDSAPIKMCYKMLMRTTFRLISFIALFLLMMVFIMCVLLAGDHKTYSHLPTYIYVCATGCGLLSLYLLIVTIFHRRQLRAIRLREERIMLERFEERRQQELQRKQRRVGISLHREPKRERFRTAQYFNSENWRRPKETCLGNNSRNKNVYCVGD